MVQEYEPDGSPMAPHCRMSRSSSGPDWVYDPVTGKPEEAWRCYRECFLVNNGYCKHYERKKEATELIAAE